MTRKSWGVFVAVLILVGAPGLLAPAGAVDPAPPVNQIAPTVSGTPRVGAVLSATPGTWSPTPTSYSYSWLRDGVVIPGAHAATYRPVGADRQHHLAVSVLARGETTPAVQAATSTPTSAIGYGVFSVIKAPSVAGVRRWGRTLTASSGSYSPTPTTVTYQWLRDGAAIKGATKATYAATATDFGTHLSVRVTLRHDDYLAGTALSPSTGLIGHRVGVRKSFTYSIGTRGRITANLKVFARIAAQVYANPRGWRSAGYEFRQVAHGGDFTLVLSNARQMPSFGYPCDSTWSCRVGRNVIINQTRWLHASPAWNAAHQPRLEYRTMVIDHETGHWLGHHHLTCPGKGQLAPLMMQQSKGLHGCRFNPYPLPSERWTNR
ncbi:MAG TPA: DUF3152 domain-containing protein [Marmoricola sp.]|jgi:hypothetical protein|nr:DUF3152 domain-containing protein [Marmoricola sp.]